MDGIKFWKMHGLGNDYIIIDNRNPIIEEKDINAFAKRVCQRKFSVGADGVIFLVNSKQADVKMRIFNADGSEAEMCGNGIRCLAKYCYDNKIIRKENFVVETLAGIKHVKVISEGNEAKNIYVNMGRPDLERRGIPMRGEGRCINEPLKVGSREVRITCLSVGNPHCVVFVDNTENFSVEEMGPNIELNELFPKRTNVEFVQVLNRKEIRVRVWERGVGETLACGTGACAAVVAGHMTGKCNREVVVHLLGGDLKIQYHEDIALFGPAETVFEGLLSLE